MTDLGFVRRLLSEQRARAVGTLLTSMERMPWWTKLSGSEKEVLKRNVLATVGSYHDTVLDILKASGLENGEAVLNELALTAMAELNRRLARVQKSLDDRDG